jgi:hypothetical protein
MRSQHFEGGLISLQPETGPIAIPRAVFEFISRSQELVLKLGHPVSEEQPVGTNDGRIQYFENGVVTLRDGKREAWVRPESAVETTPVDEADEPGTSSPEVEEARPANPYEAGVAVPGWKSFPR